MGQVQEIEAAVARVVTEVGAAVVGLRAGRGGGSGVVFAEGLVLTNAHNLRGEEATVLLPGGTRASGRLRGVALDQDVALIEVDTGETEPVAWAEEEARVGQAVLALADPGGRGLRVSPGFVCATAQSFRGPRGRRVPGAIEHTAPLPRGSSGGPLLDLDGRLLGLNTVRVEGGLILALPADAALRTRLEGLARGTATDSPRLGVAIAPPRAARQLRRAVGLPERAGALIRAVESGGPAARAGLERGDLIVAAAGRPVEHVDVLLEGLDQAAAQGAIQLTIVRGSDERTVDVALSGS